MECFARFATPIFIADVAGAGVLNPELAALLLAEEGTAPGLERSNAGGWHSIPDLAGRPEPCLRAVLGAVLQRVVDAVALLAGAAGLPAPRFDCELHAWAMIMRAGDAAVLHDHGDAHWSSVYYVDAGDDDSGRLVFVDPRRAGRPIPGPSLLAPTFELRPRTGALVLFPGWLEHRVDGYRGQRPRISISSNIVLGLAGAGI